MKVFLVNKLITPRHLPLNCASPASYDMNGNVGYSMMLMEFPRPRVVTGTCLRFFVIK